MFCCLDNRAFYFWLCSCSVSLKFVLTFLSVFLKIYNYLILFVADCIHKADTSLGNTRRHMVIGSRQAVNAFEGMFFLYLQSIIEHCVVYSKF